MKKILSLVIISGFVIMVGAAGGVDLSGAGLLTAFLLELVGMAMVFFGTSALMHYKRFLRRIILRKRLANSNSLCKKSPVEVKICLAKKELC